jgi:hypothetical protein
MTERRALQLRHRSQIPASLQQLNPPLWVAKLHVGVRVSLKAAGINWPGRFLQSQSDVTNCSKAGHRAKVRITHRVKEVEVFLLKTSSMAQRLVISGQIASAITKFL